MELFSDNLKKFINFFNEPLNQSICIAICLLLSTMYNVFIVFHNTGVFFVGDHGRILPGSKRHRSGNQ